MNRNAKFLLSMLAAALCLISTACSNKDVAWNNYALGYPDADPQPAIIYGIKD